MQLEKRMLEGKTAVITGASYGMGRTMAELFAEEGAGVVLTARGQEKLNQVVEGIRANGGKAVGVVADVCSTEGNTRLIAQSSCRSRFLPRSGILHSSVLFIQMKRG